MISLSLSPQRKVIFETLAVTQQVREVLSFYRTLWFITVFTSVRHWII
jgi:hypothetical protein